MTADRPPAPRVDYDTIASAYDRRYADHDYGGVHAALRDFVAAGCRVLEVGCGTGHWLAQMRAWGCEVRGIDPSARMLARAAERLGAAALARGVAEALPWNESSFDRVVCVNALHHFGAKDRFLHEARRVLCRGGRFLSIGLDPSAGPDRWFVYDYFERTLELDRERYPSARQIRGWLEQAGFTATATVVAERMQVDFLASDLLARGPALKTNTSQLALLSAAEYRRGIEAIRRDLVAAEARGEQLRLTGDLRLFATVGIVPA